MLRIKSVHVSRAIPFTAHPERRDAAVEQSRDRRGASSAAWLVRRSFFGATPDTMPLITAPYPCASWKSLLRRLHRGLQALTPAPNESDGSQIHPGAMVGSMANGACRSSAQFHHPDRFYANRIFIWSLEGKENQVLVGILASTEHVTVGKIHLLPRQKSDVQIHDGDESPFIYWRKSSTCMSPKTMDNAGLNSTRAMVSIFRRVRHISTTISRISR